MSHDDALKDAKAATKAAQENLAQARQSGGLVRSLAAGLESILEDNHFSIRIARSYGLEPPEK